MCCAETVSQGHFQFQICVIMKHHIPVFPQVGVTAVAAFALLCLGLLTFGVLILSGVAPGAAVSA
jgi:hypothetical protein